MKKGFFESKNRVFLPLNFLFSTFSTLVFIVVIFFGYSPYVSIKENVYKNYSNQINSNMHSYIRNIESFIQNLSQREDFKKEISNTLNNRLTVLSEAKFIQKPLTAISLILNDNAFERGYHIQDKKLITSIPFGENYFSVRTVSFIFDFVDILREVVSEFSSNFDVLMVGGKDVLFVHKDVRQYKNMDIDTIGNYLDLIKKEGVFVLEEDNLGVYSTTLHSVGSRVFFVYDETLFSIPVLSQIILIYLIFQTLFLFVLFFKERSTSLEKKEEKKGLQVEEIKKPSKVEKKVNTEIVQLLETIDQGSKKNSKKTEKLNSKDIVRVLQKMIEDEIDLINFISVFEKETRLLANAFFFKKEGDIFIYFDKIRLIGNNLDQFEIKKETTLVNVLSQGNILNIPISEIKNTIINQYLDPVDKKTFKEVFFIPLFQDKEMMNIIILAI